MTVPGAWPDAAARQRVTHELSTSFALSGPPGSGTTGALVDRVVALLKNGCDADDLAVVVATPAAVLDVRRRLARRADEESTHAPVAPGRGGQLDATRRVAVRTVTQTATWLVSGARGEVALLHPAEDRSHFDADFERAADSLLAEADAERLLRRAFELGFDPAVFKATAWEVRQHPDWFSTRYERRAHPDATSGSWDAIDAGAVVEALERAIALSAQCTDDEDLLREHLTVRLTEAREQLDAAGDEATVLSLLVGLPPFSSAFGRRENWDGRSAEARAACAAAEEVRQAVLRQAREPIVRRLVAHLDHAAGQDAARRWEAGRLTEGDVLARAGAFIDDPTVAPGVPRRLRHLLVDDLRGTDGVERALVARLVDVVTAVDADPGPDAPATALVVRPGAMDVAGLTEVTLEANLRSVPGIVAFAAQVADGLLDPAITGATGDRAGSTVREPLDTGVRSRAGVQLSLPGLDQGEAHPPRLELPPVVAVGGAIEGSARVVRVAAGRDVAAVLRRAITERWPVTGSGTEGTARPARYADVVVALSDRRAWPALEEALEEAGVPYRLADRALLWGTETVRDVLSVLGAADDPNDPVMVLAALRSSGLACGDDDLLSWRAAGGTWDPLADAPTGTESHPVTRALAALARLHRSVAWAGPTELVRRTLAEIRAYELSVAQPDPAGHWHVLEWLLAQVQDFEDTSAGTTRQFLRWAEIEAHHPSAPADAVVAIDDAVTVVTSAAIGEIESPIVVVAGIDTEPPFTPSPALWRADGLEARFGGGLRTSGYDVAADAARAEAEAERRRLLWLALTRARDHVVVCLHHRWREGTPDSSPGARLAELCRAHPLLWRRVQEPAATADATASATPPVRDPDAGRVWRAEVAAFEEARARHLLGRRSLAAVAADDIAPSTPRVTAAGSVEAVDSWFGAWASSWALGRRQWRDLSVRRALPVEIDGPAAPGDESVGIFEAVIPLVVEDHDGLAVVGPARGDRETDGALLALATQADALEQATGVTVTRCVLVGVDGRQHELRGDALADAQRHGRRTATELATARA